jgi:hypothetical protein
VTEPPTTTVAPTTTLDPIAAAGQYYMEKVKPINCVNGLYNLVQADVFGADNQVTEGEWPKVRDQMQPISLQYSQALVTWVNDLVAYDWPDDVQPSVDALMADATQQATNFEQLGKALSFNNYFEISDSQQWPQSNNAAVVRAKLGLPSNINDDTNYCESLIPTPTTAA